MTRLPDGRVRIELEQHWLDRLNVALAWTAGEAWQCGDWDIHSLAIAVSREIHEGHENPLDLGTPDRPDTPESVAAKIARADEVLAAFRRFLDGEKT